MLTVIYQQSLMNGTKVIIKCKKQAFFLIFFLILFNVYIQPFSYDRSIRIIIFLNSALSRRLNIFPFLFFSVFQTPYFSFLLRLAARALLLCIRPLSISALLILSNI